MVKWVVTTENMTEFQRRNSLVMSESYSENCILKVKLVQTDPCDKMVLKNLIQYTHTHTHMCERAAHASVVIIWLKLAESIYSWVF